MVCEFVHFVVWGVGCGVSGVGCLVSGVGCRVSGAGCRARGSGARCRGQVRGLDAGGVISCHPRQPRGPAVYHLQTSSTHVDQTRQRFYREDIGTENHCIKLQRVARRSKTGVVRTSFSGLGPFYSGALPCIRRAGPLFGIGHLPSEALSGCILVSRFSGSGRTLDAVTIFLYRVVVSATLAPLSRTKCANFPMSVPRRAGFGGYLSRCVSCRGQGLYGQGSRVQGAKSNIQPVFKFRVETRPVQIPSGPPCVFPQGG